MDLHAGSRQVRDTDGGQGRGLRVLITFRGFSGVGASSTEASISLAGIQVS